MNQVALVGKSTERLVHTVALEGTSIEGLLFHTSHAKLLGVMLIT